MVMQPADRRLWILWRDRAGSPAGPKALCVFLLALEKAVAIE